MSRTRTTQSRIQHAKIKPSKNLELRISNPKLEIPLILGGIGFPGLLHVHGEGNDFDRRKNSPTFLGISNWIEWSTVEGVIGRVISKECLLITSFERQKL